MGRERKDRDALVPGWGVDIAVLLLRLGLAGVFLYSSWPKIRDPFTFMEKVHEYDVLPAAWVQPFSYLLPASMFLCAFLLALGLFTRPAAAGLGLMLISFIIAISINIYRDRVMGCGCFSEEGQVIGWDLLLQDFSLLLFCLYLVLRGARRFSLDALLPRHRLLPRRPTKGKPAEFSS